MNEPKFLSASKIIPRYIGSELHSIFEKALKLGLSG